MAFDAHDYKNRNVVEHAFNHLKNWRGLATRYDKTRTRLPRRRRPRIHPALAVMTYETRPSRLRRRGRGRGRGRNTLHD